MKKIFLIFMLLCFSFTIALAKPRYFTKIVGDLFDDIARCVRITEDGGFVVAGYIDRRGEDIYDIMIRKYNEDGSEDWFEIYISNYIDKINSICFTQDSEYAACGYTENPSRPNKELAVMKASKLGQKIWATTFGGSEDEVGHSIQLTYDNNFLIAGSTESFGAGKKDMWVVKVNRKKGFKIWSQYFGGKEDDVAYSIQPTKDTGYIVAGFTKSFKAKKADLWILKVNRTKTKEWAKIFGGSKNEKAMSVIELKDGYAIAGFTESVGSGQKDFILLKLDKNGKKIWSKAYGGKKNEVAYSVFQTQDKGFILAGFTESFGAGEKDVWIVKTDKNGDKQWNRTFGGKKNEVAYSIEQASDGGYILVGYTESFGKGFKDFYIIRTDKKGRIPE